MFQAFARAVSRIYEVFWMLVITALLGAATVAMWHFYEQEHLKRQFQERGTPVTVQVERIDQHRRDSWDALGNFSYVGFTYRNHPYEVRWVFDSVWVSAGDRLKLLYNPHLDAFGQAQRVAVSSPTRVVSRLINWTVIRNFKRDNQLLGGLILAAMALFFCGSSVVASLTGWTFIRRVAGAVFITALGVSAGFFTYNAFEYYRYFDTLRTNGRPLTVAVLAIDRHSHGRGRKGGSWRWYTYDATFRYEARERVVPIDEADYERLQTGGNQLAVRYDAAVNDFIAVNYTPGFTQLILPVVFWLLFVQLIRSTATRQPVAPPGTT